jgi:hypothetical protein
MGHVTKETPRAVIDINTSTGQILVRQRWQYRWLISPGMPPWTYAEKLHFHKMSDRAIWDVWSNRARLAVYGSSDFAKRFMNYGCPVNCDISWVTANPHWLVDVKKMPKGIPHKSKILWDSRRVLLGSTDFAPTIRTGNNGQKIEQKTAAHEFAHTFGNVSKNKRGDEYPKKKVPNSPHVLDQNSILNIGMQLRERHFRTLLEELHPMIKDTGFVVGSLKK